MHYLCSRDFDYSERTSLLTLFHQMMTYECDLSSQNARGETPLHFAVLGFANPITISFLITHGADPTVLDCEGQTAYDKGELKPRTEGLDILKTFSPKKEVVASQSSFLQKMQHWAKLSDKDLLVEIQKDGLTSPQPNASPNNNPQKMGKLSVSFLGVSDELFDNTSLQTHTDLLGLMPSKVNDIWSRHQILFLLAMKIDISSKALPWWPLPLLPNRSILISCKSEYIDAVLYPAWSNILVRSILILHPKYIQTEELLELLVRECESLWFLFRVLALWLRDSRMIFLNNNTCKMLLKELYVKVERVEKGFFDDFTSPLREDIEWVRFNLNCIFFFFVKFKYLNRF
jgi:hypothetical protein